MRCSTLTALLVALLVSFSCAARNPRTFALGKHLLRLGGKKIQVLIASKKNDGGFQLRSEISASGFDLSRPYKRCDTGDDVLCLKWENSTNFVTLRVIKKQDECETFGVTSDPSVELFHCFPYGEDEWYGGPERFQQDYPVQHINADYEPYVTTSKNNQGVVEPYWVTSAGASINVEPNSPLFFDSNVMEPGQLCLIAANKDPYKPRNTTFIQTTTCAFDNPVEAHYDAVNRFGKPPVVPSPNMIKYPIYSTWVEYKADINQTTLREFTDSILDRGFPIGQIEIDDKWEPCYGSLVFDTNKFPNVSELVGYIHSKGGRASAWVHPYVNIGCDGLFEQYRDEGRLILNDNGSASTVWWNGAAGAVDLTNQTTRDWWVGRLKNLLKTSGLNTFKFDGGESSWLPQLPNIIGDPELYPDSQIRNYVEAAISLGGDLEVRVGKDTQDIPVFMRMLDKDSRWGLDNGLQSVITTAFQMSLTGYPFILPDMIGGNAYGVSVSKELFIRWLQVNALLPSMQFSLLPWNYDDETVEISRRYVELHSNYSYLLLEAAERTVTDGRPIIAPIWWIDPTDKNTWAIRDEYLAAETLLVAPVVEDGARQRDIYLPKGTWVDTRNITYKGPTWLYNYSAPLDFLPLFTRQIQLVDLNICQNEE